MVAGIELWQFAPSFNSRKVRYALGMKGVSYTIHEVPPGQNEQVIEVSGQPMTPVLRHDGVVIFDSGAIVRYIDANIEGPRLFSPSIDEMRTIEQWESRGKEEILKPYLQIMGQVRSGTMDAAVIEDGRQGFLAGAKVVEDSLNEHGVLVGENLSAADIFCACYLAYGFLTEAEAEGRPPLMWSLENLSIAGSFPDLARWFERLRAVEQQSNS